MPMLKGGWATSTHERRPHCKHIPAAKTNPRNKKKTKETPEIICVNMPLGIQSERKPVTIRGGTKSDKICCTDKILYFSESRDTNICKEISNNMNASMMNTSMNPSRPQMLTRVETLARTSEPTSAGAAAAHSLLTHAGAVRWRPRVARHLPHAPPMQCSVAMCS